VEKRSKTISVRVLYMGVMLIRQKMVGGWTVIIYLTNILGGL
jgi:heme A synthase